MVTIRDVAKAAGVSVATVSRVLNESGYSDKDTKARVSAVAERLGYQRNVNWSRLASQRSQTVLFLLGNRDALNSMQMRLLVGAERALQQEGYDLVFSRHVYQAGERPDVLKLPRMAAQSGAVDGIILAGLHHPNLLQALSKRKLPSVLLGNNYSGREQKQNAVYYDDENGLLEAATYLVRLGHQRIAFVGNGSKPWFARRRAGYRKAMELARREPIEVVDDWQVSTSDYGQLAVAELLRSEAPPSAIIAGNDEIAAGAWKELARRRIALPTEMSLVGFGDRAEFSILEPALTTVSVFEDQLGERLAQMLLARLRSNNKPVTSEHHPCKLIERHSCAPWKHSKDGLHAVRTWK